MQARNVLVADDHPLTREGLGLAARAAMPGISVDNAGSIEEAEAAIARRGEYRLTLLDLGLPDAHGFSGFLRLQHRLGRTPIVIVTAHRDPKLVEAARALGAAGYLLKSSSIDELSQAIRRIAEGTVIFPAMANHNTSEVANARSRLDNLSGAQMRVLLAMADGRNNKQIAGDLDISEATVKAHLTAIFRKLHVTNRTQALLAMQPLFGDTAPDQTL